MGEQERPPTQVFLSFAMEDLEVARKVYAELRNRQLEIYWSHDESRRGQRWLREMEKHLIEADFFIALLSPAFLASPWCERERNLAIQREVDLKTQFIRVVKVADLDRSTAGLLREYDWLDLTGPIEDKLPTLWGSRELEDGPKVVAQHVFRNRDDELNTILNALRVTGGNDFWLVTSHPRLGKSWFLRRLQSDLNKDTTTTRTVHLVDAHDQPLDARSNPALLLRALLELDAPLLPNSADLSDHDVLSAIANTIAERRRPQCWLLDSADLLDESCCAILKSTLTAIHHLVKLTGREETRISVVVASRRDDWLGAGSAEPAARFRPLPLTAFGEHVVHQALADLGRAVGPVQLRDYASRLLRLSEGLPAVLVQGLRWADETGFLSWDRWNDPATFERVAGSYIRDDLLSADSLLPQGGSNLGTAKQLIDRAFRVLVVYRLFTHSHLREHIDADPDFQYELAAARWSFEDLWGQISHTALLEPQGDNLWQVIHPPIRRLLYRHYHPSVEDRRRTHTAAREFCDGWTRWSAGTDQGVMLVECLWHEAMQLLAADDRARADSLPEAAATLAGRFKAPMWSPSEFSAFLSRRLRRDDEFQLALRGHDGLFDRMIQSVVATISGGMS